MEAAETPAPPPVHLGRVERVQETPTTEGTAEIRPRRIATLRAEAPGRIVALPAERGQRVEANTILARLDTGRTAAAVGAANAGIEQATANLAQMTRERDLAERLAAQGSLAQQQLDRARDAVALAQAGLAQAQAQYRLTRRGLTEAVLRAPFAGTVVELTVEEGEFVAPGAPMLVLVDASELEARVLLDPRQALDIQPGASASATVFARDDEQFSARVLRVSEVVDSRTRRLPVDVEVLDPQGRLRPGLMARIAVSTGPAEDVLVVPEAAVFPRFGRDHVYQVVDGVARRQEITVRSRRAGRVLVSAGLREGAEVIVAGLDRVVPDEPVTVVPVAPSEDEGSASVPTQTDHESQTHNQAEGS